MCLLWPDSVFCDTKDTFILHPPPDSWQVFLHAINIFLLLFYIYKTALLPGVLRRSESCFHKSSLPTLSLHTCLVGNFICKSTSLRTPVTKNYWSDSDFWYFSYENMAFFLKYLPKHWCHRNIFGKMPLDFARKSRKNTKNVLLIADLW